MSKGNLISWSHSRVNEFLRCGFKMFMISIAKKVPFKETPATREGKRVHKELELRVRDGKPLPPDLAFLEPMAAQIVAAPGDVFCECELALDREFRPCGYRDWDNAWVRVIIDVLKINGRTAWAGDYKTGTPSMDEYQLMLTAAVLFQVFPQLDTVTTTYIWTKTGKVDPDDSRTYKREIAPQLWDILLPRYAELQHANEDNEWPKRPDERKCGYCEVNAAGLCDKAARPPRK